MRNLNIGKEILIIKDEILKELNAIDKSVFDFSEFNNLTGKGIRAKFTLHLMNSLNVDSKKYTNIPVACELVHLASLLHDDCIDDAVMRRGYYTINYKYGINRAILVGDLIVSVALKKINSILPYAVIDLVNCVENMSKGALLEENVKFKIIDENTYTDIVKMKTIALFKWAGFSVALINMDKNYFSLIEKIAYNFGLSFQIIDDVLDMQSNAEEIGKDSFKDLSEGKITYPILSALKDNYVKERVEKFFNNKLDYTPVYEIREYIKKEGYLEKSREYALKLIEDIRESVLSLPDKDSAIDFYNFMYALVNRKM